MGKRCTGHCCKNIGLPVSPEEMKDSYNAWIKRSGNESFSKAVLSMSKKETYLKVYSEIHLVYPMLTYLRKSTTHPDGGKQGKGNGEKPTVYHYKCKHLINSKCSIYEDRPEMCRSHARESMGCGYTQCKWDDAVERRKKWNENNKDLSIKKAK